MKTLVVLLVLSFVLLAQVVACGNADVGIEKPAAVPADAPVAATIPDSGSAPVLVSLGQDQEVQLTPDGKGVAVLDYTVSGSNVIQVGWRSTGTVFFWQSGPYTESVAFTESGIYTIRVTATDTVTKHTAFDEIVVTVKK